MGLGLRISSGGVNSSDGQSSEVGGKEVLRTACGTRLQDLGVSQKVGVPF